MSLPVGQQLTRETVLVAGQPVEIRSLSRKEAMEMRKFTDDPDAGEVFLIARATDSSEDDARRFRETTNSLEVDDLLDAIVVLSGIDQVQKKLEAKARENSGRNP